MFTKFNKDVCSVFETVCLSLYRATVRPNILASDIYVYLVTHWYTRRLGFVLGLIVLLSLHEKTAT